MKQERVRKIQFEISEEDYLKLEREARSKKMGVYILIREKLFPNDKMVKNFTQIMEQLIDLAHETTNRRFDIPYLYDEWEHVPRELKGIIGKVFYDLVVNSGLPELKNIYPIEKKKVNSTNVRMQYRKDI